MKEPTANRRILFSTHEAFIPTVDGALSPRYDGQDPDERYAEHYNESPTSTTTPEASPESGGSR